MVTWKNLFWVLLSVQAIGVDLVYGVDFPMDRLLEDLMENYSRFVRPVHNQYTVMMVYINLTSVRYIAVREKEQFFSIHMSYSMFWRDEQLTWDPESYGGVPTMHILAADIWIPDIVISEQSPRKKSIASHYAVANSSGWITMEFSLKTNCTCFFNIFYFPFDKHNCTLNFMPWVHSTEELEVGMLESKEDFEDRYRDIEFGGEWKMTGLQTFHSNIEIQGKKYAVQSFNGEVYMLVLLGVSWASRLLALVDGRKRSHGVLCKESVSYRRHPEINNKFLPRLTAGKTTEYHRAQPFPRDCFGSTDALIPTFYISRILIPTLLLILADFVSFLLPVSGKERTSMKVNILLGYTFFLFVVIDLLPATAVSPLIAIYLTACSLILSTSIVATILLIRMSHIPKNKNTPWKSHGVWLKVKKSIEFITKSRSIELTTLNVAAETRISKATNKKQDKRKAEDLDCGFFILYSITIVIVGLIIGIMWANVEIVPG